MCIRDSFLPYVNNDACIGCGKCTKICPIEVISLKNKKASIDESICLGCGVCVRNCPTTVSYTHLDVYKRQLLGFLE